MKLGEYLSKVRKLDIAACEVRDIMQSLPTSSAEHRACCMLVHRLNVKAYMLAKAYCAASGSTHSAARERYVIA